MKQLEEQRNAEAQKEQKEEQKIAKEKDEAAQIKSQAEQKALEMEKAAMKQAEAIRKKGEEQVAETLSEEKQKIQSEEATEQSKIGMEKEEMSAAEAASQLRVKDGKQKATFDAKEVMQAARQEAEQTKEDAHAKAAKLLHDATVKAKEEATEAAANARASQEKAAAHAEDAAAIVKAETEKKGKEMAAAIMSSAKSEMKQATAMEEQVAEPTVEKSNQVELLAETKDHSDQASTEVSSVRTRQAVPPGAPETEGPTNGDIMAVARKAEKRLLKEAQQEATAMEQRAKDLSRASQVASSQAPSLSAQHALAAALMMAKKKIQDTIQKEHKKTAQALASERAVASEKLKEIQAADQVKQKSLEEKLNGMKKTKLQEEMHLVRLAKEHEEGVQKKAAEQVDAVKQNKVKEEMALMRVAKQVTQKQLGLSQAKTAQLATKSLSAQMHATALQRDVARTQAKLHLAKNKNKADTQAIKVLKHKLTHVKKFAGDIANQIRTSRNVASYKDTMKHQLEADVTSIQNLATREDAREKEEKEANHMFNTQSHLQPAVGEGKSAGAPIVHPRVAKQTQHFQTGSSDQGSLPKPHSKAKDDINDAILRALES